MNQNTNQNWNNLLNILLEAERAGVKVLHDLVSQLDDEEEKKLANKFLHDEGMNCQILKTIIENLGGEVSLKTGDFVQKIEALPTIEDKLILLIKGQEWVAKKIKESRQMAFIVSDQIFLEAIKIQHEENVYALKKYLGINEIGKNKNK